MPTGYTKVIADDITFNDFVMNCARAMGALARKRDEPPDAPIPDRFEPSNYCIEKIAEANLTLVRLSEMTMEEAEQAADAEYKIAILSQVDSIQRNDSLCEKYHTMLEQVNAWNSPSIDHDGFKQFMIEQLTSTIDFDCNSTYHRDNPPYKLEGVVWLAREAANALKDITYQEAQHAKEIERTNARNKWVKELRDSLKYSPITTIGN